jgi:hypothetical protein
MGFLWDALFLQRRAYQAMADDDNPFVEGLFVLVVVGVLVALAGIVGTTLEWASSPNLNAIQEVVLRNLQGMPWWSQMEQAGGAEATQMFQQIWDMNWQIVSVLTPSPASSLAGIVTVPLGLIFGWLLFGVIAHALARLFGGTATLSQTLGVTALAAAPQLVSLVTVIPFAVVAGVGTWTLLCRYMALRTAHDLSWPRAVWATILPPIILGLIFGVLITLLVVLFGAGMATLFAGMFGGGQ